MAEIQTEKVKVTENYIEDLALMHPDLAKSYHSIQKFDSGSQGTMLKAIDVNGRTVAIKVFDISAADSLKSLDLFYREIQTIQSLHLKGVPAYIDTVKSDRYIYLVEEYIEAPSLAKRIKNNERFSFEQKQRTFRCGRKGRLPARKKSARGHFACSDRPQDHAG